MPRKTLILIFALVLVTIVLFVVALKESSKEQVMQPGSPESQQQAIIPTPTSVEHSVLSLSPNPITVAPGQKGQVDVNIDTSINAVTAVQLELNYDPTVISNVQVVPGSLFSKAVVLINKNDVKTGKITYAVGTVPNSPTVQGTGSVATITFTAKNVDGKQADITLLPETLVTARGVANSVLKSATGTTVIVGVSAQTPVVVDPNSATTDDSAPVVVGPAQ